MSVVSHFGHGKRKSVSLCVLFSVFFFLFFVLRYLVIAPVCIAKVLSAFVRQGKKSKTKLRLHNQKKKIHNIIYVLFFNTGNRLFQFLLAFQAPEVSLA